ncbi:MAG: PDZ domain-containing protein [Candidatus Blackburnbacteria bacterium]|nr:PDZ domain-containing protein [Candidatus Blackburnbacteria bacterium]
MKLTLPQIRKFAVVISLVLLSFISGWVVNERNLGSGVIDTQLTTVERQLPQNREDVDFSLFWQVWDKVESDYFDKSKINKEQMVLGAIKGMVESLKDPYTVFLPPNEQKRTQEDLDGQFEGVGIEIGFKGSRLVVQSPLEGTPAYKAGIKAGDFIVGIKDVQKKLEVATAGMNLIDAVEAIRGTAGSKVTLIIVREGEEKPLEIEIERAKIDIASVKLTFENPSASSGQSSPDNSGQIAILRLLKFGGSTEDEWKRAIREVKGRKIKGMVLDLRNNPGGYLTAAVDIASEFLPRGVVVMQEDGTGKRKEFNANGRANLAEIPLVVLVNGGSASASEIVSGALKDYSRAKIVGVTTFGKGTIQEARPIGTSSGIHITTAKWLTPKGTWVHEVGLKPDVEVKDDPETEVDEQLQKAIQLLNE